MAQETSLSGSTVATSKFAYSISEFFPSSNRSYNVESGISNSAYRDYLPINSSITNESLNGSYAEFNLNSSSVDFIDCASICLETKIKITSPNGVNLPPEAKISLIDGFSHRLISRHSLHINGCLTENSSHFGLTSSIKSYLSMSKNVLDSSGANMLYKSMDTDIVDTFDANYFIKNSENELGLIKKCKNGIIHTMSPLLLDIASTGQYLINSCDLRLRLDFSPASLLINSPDNIAYDYKIQSVKLWVKKIVPNSNALMSLNKSLLTNNGCLEYIFQRPVMQTYVYPANQQVLCLDNLYNGIIPSQIYLFFLRQSSANGSYKDNGAYFTNGNISSLRLEVNGCATSCFTTDFESDQFAQVFHHTLANIQSNDHLLSLKNFKKGRTIYCWNLTASDTGETLPIEATGNLRLNIQSKKPNTENLIVYVLGLSTAIIEIDSGRRVKTSYLM